MADRATARYLIIAGKDEESILGAVAAAADLHAKFEAEVDLAIPPAHAALARIFVLSGRIMEIDMEPSSVPDISLQGLKKGAEDAAKDGWRGLLSAAKNTAAIAAQSAKENVGQYRELLGELRDTKYDAAIDLDADAKSILCARSANAQQVYGFENLPGAVPNARLFYHDTRAVPNGLSRVEQCRTLCARLFSYDYLSSPGLQFMDNPAPAPDMPQEPFVLLEDGIQQEFIKALENTKPPVFPCPPDPEAMLAAVQASLCVAGAGIIVHLANAFDKPALYLGDKKFAPPDALLIESPAILNTAVQKILSGENPATGLAEIPTAKPSAASASASADDGLDAPKPPSSAPSAPLTASGGGISLKTSTDKKGD